MDQFLFTMRDEGAKYVKLGIGYHAGAVWRMYTSDTRHGSVVGRSGIKFKWSQPENVILVLLVIALIILLVGCASKQTKYEVRYTKGCAIDVATVTADSATAIMKSLDFEDCKLDADIGDHQKELEQ
jgi:hypothetical protein